ncbi:MAG TPA: DNA methyltransferase [Polyangia bacterium]|nr:DNA methyltransferase [Polyangia bacterium]
MERLTPKPPPRQRRAFSTLGGAVDLGGDAEAARTLERLYAVDPSLERALTHGFHSYAGRLHPSIARGAVTAFTAPGDTVVDPFCGSGTVLVEAMGLGRRAVGVDASPLAVAIARTRTTVLGEEGRERLLTEAAAIAEESGERARKRRRPDVPRWARQEIARFHAHVLFELLGLRELVMAHADDDFGRALRLCLSSILVKFMKAGPAAPRDGEAKRIARGVPSRMLADRAKELALGLAALEGRTPRGTPAPEVFEGDARALPPAAGSAALVVSSPPYAGTYDYAAIHDARFLWLGLPVKKFRRAQLGARGEQVGDVSSAAWRAEQTRFMAEVGRVLRPGGRALLVVGDGIVDGRAENAPDGIAAAGSAAGLEPIARASQARPIHDRRLAEIFAGQPRREHLLLLQKSG